MQERKWWQVAVRAAGNVLGVNEVLVAVALWLVAQGFLEFWRPGAFIVPGVVMLWMFLPQRIRFMTPQPERRKEA